MCPKSLLRALFMNFDLRYIEPCSWSVTVAFISPLSYCLSESSNKAIFYQHEWSLQTKVAEMYPDSIFAYIVYFLPRKLENFRA